MYTVVKKVNIWLILIALPFSFFYIAGKAWRWLWILRRQNIILSFGEALGIYYATFYLSLLTPGKIGDASKLFYLKGRGVKTGLALVSVLLDRMLDLVFLGLMTAIVVAALPQNSALNHKLADPFLLLTIIMVFAFLLLLKFHKPAIRLLVNLLPEQLRIVVKKEGGVFFESIKQLGWMTLIASLGITLFVWMLAYYQIWLLAKALGIQINYFTIVLLSTVISLLAILPISPSGTNIGTRDAALIAGFSWLKIGKSEEALALSMLILISIIFDTFCGYIAFSLVPIDKKGREG